MESIKTKITKNKFYFTTLIILSFLLMLFTGYGVYAISLLSGIENLLRLIVVIALIVIFILFTLFGIKITIQGRRSFLIGYIIIFLMYSFILVAISFQIHKTYGTIRGITSNYTTYSSSLVTKSDNQVDDINSLSNGKLGMIVDDSSIDGYQIPIEIIDKYNLENEVVEYDSFISLIFALLEEEITYAFLPTNFPVMFLESEELKEIADDTKIIYTKQRRVESSRRRTGGRIGDPFTILLMGVDSTSKDVSSSSFNGDALMLITFNPETLESTMLSIPRDTYVPISCFNDRHNKITHAAWFGEDCMITTIENFTEIEIDYYVKMNFTGLVNLIDSLGGIEVDVPYSFCEQDSQRRWGENIVYVEQGIQTLNGEQALALTRNRKDNSRICGSQWGGYNSNDFVRGENQQLVIKGILDSAKEIRSIDTINNIISVIGNSLETNMNTSEIFSFYDIFRRVVSTNEKLPFGDPVLIKRLRLSGYDQHIVDYSYLHRAGTRLSLYNFVPYDESIDLVVNEMQINLGHEKREINYNFNLDLSEPYSQKVIGSLRSGSSSVSLMPNFVSRNISELNTFANQNGIRVIVNNITSHNENDFVGMIRSQNIMPNIDSRYIGNEIRVDVVSKIEQNGTPPSTTSNCSSEDFKSDDNCLLRDLTGMTKNQVSNYFSSRGVIVNIIYETITIDMEEYDKGKENTIIKQSSRISTRLFDLHEGDITLTYMDEYIEETEEDEDDVEEENEDINNEE